MNKKYVLGFIFCLLLATSVLATTRVYWPNSYVNQTGVKALNGKACGAAASSVGWTTLTWTESSVNTTNCADTVRCSIDAGASYGTWKTNGTSVAISGTKLQCQWNLTQTESDQSNCSVSGFSALCGGFSETYTASDAPTSLFDFFVTVIVGMVAVASLVGIVLIWQYRRWLKKLRK